MEVWPSIEVVEEMMSKLDDQKNREFQIRNLLYGLDKGDMTMNVDHLDEKCFKDAFSFLEKYRDEVISPMEGLKKAFDSSPLILHPVSIGYIPTPLEYYEQKMYREEPYLSQTVLDFYDQLPEKVERFTRDLEEKKKMWAMDLEEKIMMNQDIDHQVSTGKLTTTDDADVSAVNIIENR